MAELTLNDLRSVDAFRGWMVQKLDENRHKGNRGAWISEDAFPIEEAKNRLLEEVLEVYRALDSEEATSAQIIRECADVANIAMMIADKTGELRTLDPLTNR